MIKKAQPFSRNLFPQDFCLLDELEAEKSILKDKNEKLEAEVKKAAYRHQAKKEYPCLRTKKDEEESITSSGNIVSQQYVDHKEINQVNEAAKDLASNTPVTCKQDLKSEINVLQDNSNNTKLPGLQQAIGLSQAFNNLSNEPVNDINQNQGQNDNRLLVDIPIIQGQQLLNRILLKNAWKRFLDGYNYIKGVIKFKKEKKKIVKKVKRANKHQMKRTIRVSTINLIIKMRGWIIQIRRWILLTAFNKLRGGSKTLRFAILLEVQLTGNIAFTSMQKAVFFHRAHSMRKMFGLWRGGFLISQLDKLRNVKKIAGKIIRNNIVSSAFNYWQESTQMLRAASFHGAHLNSQMFKSWGGAQQQMLQNFKIAEGISKIQEIFVKNKVLSTFKNWRVFTPMPKVPPLSRTQITKKKLRAATKEWKGNYGNFPASVHESNGVGSNNHVKYTKILTKQEVLMLLHKEEKAAKKKVTWSIENTFKEDDLCKEDYGDYHWTKKRWETIPNYHRRNFETTMYMKNKGAPAFQQALFLGFKEYIADLHRPSLTVQFCVGMAYEEGNTPLLEILEKFREEIPGSIGEEGIMLFKEFVEFWEAEFQAKDRM